MKQTSLVVTLALSLLTALAISCGGTTSSAYETQLQAPAVHATTSDLPSKSSQMICSQGLRGIIQKSLAMAELPPIKSSWVDHVYTCTYTLEGGPLIISVKELADVPNALRDFDGLVANLGNGDPIVGVASLGLSGYKSAGGVVLFTKDNMTLEVDASGLPRQNGPYLTTPPDFAYQVAASILACWSGE